MNCQQAKELIDERVHDGAAPSIAPQRATGLDAHLAGCPKCAASLAELMRTREVLAEATQHGWLLVFSHGLTDRAGYLENRNGRSHLRPVNLK